jgi:hypothetical protein
MLGAGGRFATRRTGFATRLGFSLRAFLFLLKSEVTLEFLELRDLVLLAFGRAL